MKTHIKKRIWLYIILVIASVIGFSIFRQYNPNVGFTYYEPSYLPPNTTIKAKRISMGPGQIHVEQNFRTEDWVYSIDEFAGDWPLGNADQNYDQKSVEPTCSIRITPAKMRYRVCHWIDYGHIDVHEVTFTKEKTSIVALIPTSLSRQLVLSDIDTFVDSFEKKSTIGLPVLRAVGP